MNGAHVVFWLAGNVYFFVSGFERFKKEDEYYIFYMLGYSISIAKGSASALNFNCALVLLPVCHNTISILRSCARQTIRTTRQLENRVFAHKIISYAICLWSVIHVTAHAFTMESFVKGGDDPDPLISALNHLRVFNSSWVNPVSRLHAKPVFEMVKLLAGWTGAIITIILLLLFASSRPHVRQKSFELFYYTHHLSIIFFVFLIFHGFEGVIRSQKNLKEHTPSYCASKSSRWGFSDCPLPIFVPGVPKAWKWVLPGIVLYLVECCVRVYRRFQMRQIIRVVFYQDEVVEIIIEKKKSKNDKNEINKEKSNKNEKNEIKIDKNEKNKINKNDEEKHHQEHDNDGAVFETRCSSYQNNKNNNDNKNNTNNDNDNKNNKNNNDDNKNGNNVNRNNDKIEYNSIYSHANDNKNTNNKEHDNENDNIENPYKNLKNSNEGFINDETCGKEHDLEHQKDHDDKRYGDENDIHCEDDIDEQNKDDNDENLENYNDKHLVDYDIDNQDRNGIDKQNTDDSVEPYEDNTDRQDKDNIDRQSNGIDKQPRNHKHPGELIKIMCPSLSFFQWHPFTLTSIPEDDHISVLIRVLGGWTNKFHQLLKQTPYPKVAIDGPYGSCCQDIYRYRSVLMVGTGIGVTPFIPVLKHLILNNPARLEHCYFVLVCRYQGFGWLHEMLMRLTNYMGASKREKISIHLYWTKDYHLYQQMREDDLTGTTSQDSKVIEIHEGRPDWNKVISTIAKNHREHQTGVFSCGGRQMCRQVRKACSKQGFLPASIKPKFVVHKEKF